MLQMTWKLVTTECQSINQEEITTIALLEAAYIALCVCVCMRAAQLKAPRRWRCTGCVEEAVRQQVKSFNS